MEQQHEEFELNLVDLFYYLKKKVLLIAAACIVCGLLGFVVSNFVMDHEYTAETRMYVLNRSSEESLVYSDFQASNQILTDYSVLITGQNVTKEVIKQLRLEMEPEILSDMIDVTAIDDSRVLQIDVVDTDPHRAAAIANCVREVAIAQINEIMGVNAVTEVYEADIPEEQSGPNVLMNTALLAVAGLMLAVIVFTVLFIMDDTIRTEEDVARYLGLSVLGAIPESEGLESSLNARAPGKKK